LKEIERQKRKNKEKRRGRRRSGEWEEMLGFGPFSLVFFAGLPCE
jgi:hypothetical protein